MITIQATGGLGNQMFVYAAGLALAKKLKTSLHVQTMEGNPKRSYALGSFRLAPDDSQVKPSLASEARITNQSVTFREAGYTYDERFASIRGPNTTLEGYFQSWRYFVGHEHEVREAFSIDAPLSALTHQILMEIASAAFPVALHVRRGDYLTEPHKSHGVLGLPYYDRAVDLIRKHGTPQYFIFTDDPEWVSNYIVPRFGGRLIQGNNYRPWEDVLLMSRCAGIVVANSTFSWWGAWLGTEKLITVAPRQWFDAPTLRLNNTCDLCPPGWLLV